MRSLCEIFIIGALLYLGWDIPFSQRLDQLGGKGDVGANASAARSVSAANKPPQTVLAPVAQTTAPNNGSAPLRQPFNTTTGLPPAPRPAGTTNSGSWMWDPNHRSTLDPPKKAATPP